MSCYRFMSTWPTDVGDVMEPAAEPKLVFPFPVVDSAVVPGGFFPFALTWEQCIELWWRARRFSLSFFYDDGSDNTTTGITLQRKFAGVEITDEADLMRAEEDTGTGTPTNTFSGLWHGTYSNADWNGSGGVMTLDCSLHMFFRGIVTDATAGPDAFAHWPDDATVYPSLSLYINGTITTPGVENTIRLRTHAAPSLTLAFRKAAANTLLGLSASGTFDDDLDATGYASALAISMWYPWTTAGGQAVWNSATGAAIVDHRGVKC